MINYEDAKEKIESIEGNVLLENKGIPYVHLSAFDEAVSHDALYNTRAMKMHAKIGAGITYGFSTRLGGVSKNEFADMNLGLKLGDDHMAVLENYHRFCSAIGVDENKISCPDQIHETRIRLVTEEDAGSGISRLLDEDHLGVDGQVTNVRNLPLIVYDADCVPIIAYDPVRKAIGTAHAGWKGSVAGIARKLISTIQGAFESDPQDILVAIGPSAGPESYIVDEDVAKAVKDAALSMNLGQAKIDKLVWGPSTFAGQENKYKVDLWRLNRAFLLDAGLRTEHIFISGLDTIALHDVFHSHRVTGGKRGLNAGIIMLK